VLALGRREENVGIRNAQRNVVEVGVNESGVVAAETIIDRDAAVGGEGAEPEVVLIVIVPHVDQHTTILESIRADLSLTSELGIGRNSKAAPFVVKILHFALLRLERNDVSFLLLEEIDHVERLIVSFADLLEHRDAAIVVIVRIVGTDFPLLARINLVDAALESTRGIAMILSKNAKSSHYNDEQHASGGWSWSRKNKTRFAISKRKRHPPEMGKKFWTK
jgi:hypothetical protein